MNSWLAERQNSSCTIDCQRPRPLPSRVKSNRLLQWCKGLPDLFFSTIFLKNKVLACRNKGSVCFVSAVATNEGKATALYNLRLYRRAMRTSHQAQAPAAFDEMERIRWVFCLVRGEW
ncbi:hypothetical protein PsorP6_000688 [Peronosclerospora sorghi]|uniref:Uncharacterized protein n=1 Tax=Peronosclerospora sorghi TaxID=230839 RepID=A0ACC0WUW2_9STRA|nr:hypothetical protein PsorP6_000688 [Peronosclerospora sorghi]